MTIASDSELPVEQARAVVVQVLDDSGRVAATAPLSPDRTARFSNLPAGQYTIDVATPGMPLRTQQKLAIVAGANEVVRVEIALQSR